MSGVAVAEPVGKPVRRFADLLIIGPDPAPDEAGCGECAERWALDVRPQAVPTSGARSAGLLEQLTARLVRLPLPSGHVMVLDTSNGSSSLHKITPHSACSRCAPLIRASAPSRWDLRSPQPPLAGSVRTRALDGQHLRDELVDWRFGPIAHVYRDEESPFPLVTAEAIAPGSAHREGGYGRASSFAESEVPALLEGVERVLGGHRQPSARTVRASWESLGDRALDPRSLAEHTPETYERADSPFRRFDPTEEMDWVEGWWLSYDRPVLVPAQLVYWHENAGVDALLYESSNGCAVGGSVEEAALHGYFEIVERDAFLLTWYGRLRLREIDISEESAFADTLLRLARDGLRLRVLDATSDLGIPVAIAIVTAPDELVRSGCAPAFSLAAGAHPSGNRAIAAAIEECVTNALMYPKWVTMRESVRVDHYRPMLHDHELVHVLEDHTGMHGLSEARGLWGFLDDPCGRVSLDEFLARGRPAPEDVVAELRHHVDVAACVGVTVLAVDQSAPHLRDMGVFAVKVMAPGTMPMTFGHLNRRVDNVPRLARAASVIHGAVPAGTWGETPPPHPFP